MYFSAKYIQNKDHFSDKVHIIDQSIKMDRLGGPQPALETFERCKLNLPNVEIYRNQLLLKTSYLTKKHAIEQSL